MNIGNVVTFEFVNKKEDIRKPLILFENNNFIKCKICCTSNVQVHVLTL